MKYEIRNRWTGKLIYSTETADSWEPVIKEAFKSSVDLQCADLRNANLQGADLQVANLQGVDLRYANLQGANLRYANLQRAGLCGVDLRYADLQNADLRYANLQDANLQYANLRGADLEKAYGIYPIVPEVGAFTGFKKLSNDTIAVIRIPADAGRVGGYTGRKCRAEKAIVLEGAGFSKRDSKFEYKPGATVIPDNWDPDPRIECSHGIHFFLTRKEAETY